MKKPFWILGVVGVVAVYVVVVATQGSSATADNDGAMANTPPPPVIEAPQAGAPNVLVEVSEHDFGMSDPEAEGSHTFLLRNQGDAPLELKRGPTTCKCTLADFPVPVIPPGGTGQVRISWTAISEKVFFNQQATVLTNDPEHESLVFRIKGEVRAHLAAQPSQIVFSSVYPGEVQTRSLTLYSQAWDDFEVRQVVASNPKFAWTIKPAPPEALSEVKALCGYVLEVTSPPDHTKTGHFQETLTLHVAPKGQPDRERRYPVVVTGNRIHWLSITGEDVQRLVGMRIGTVPFGQGFKRRITLLVRDPNRKVTVHRVETSPSFVRAVATPARTDGSWCNLYHLDLEIPPDAPLCTYLAGEKGEIRVHADDPNLPVIKTPLAFAVVREGFDGSIQATTAP